MYAEEVRIRGTTMERIKELEESLAAAEARTAAAEAALEWIIRAQGQGENPNEFYSR
jgi:hypothetical protein